MFRIFNIVEFQVEKEIVNEKVISNEKEGSENINDTESETIFALVEDPLH